MSNFYVGPFRYNGKHVPERGMRQLDFLPTVHVPRLTQSMILRFSGEGKVRDYHDLLTEMNGVWNVVGMACCSNTGVDTERIMLWDVSCISNRH